MLPTGIDNDCHYVCSLSRWWSWKCKVSSPWHQIALCIAPWRWREVRNCRLTRLRLRNPRELNLFLFHLQRLVTNCSFVASSEMESSLSRRARKSLTLLIFQARWLDYVYLTAETKVSVLWNHRTEGNERDSVHSPGVGIHLTESHSLCFLMWCAEELDRNKSNCIF